MRITAAKRSRSDIIREREAFDENAQAQEEQYQKERANYNVAHNEVEASIEDEVRRSLGSLVSALNIDIDVRENFHGGLEVRVASNQDNVHDQSKALSWDWSATLDQETGEIQKDSGSWSGLQAITSEQLESLHNSVSALEILNSIDWSSVLSVDLPDYDKYISTQPVSRSSRPNFEQELVESDIEDIIGTDEVVEMQRDTGKYYHGVVYCGILSETPKQYKVFEVHQTLLNDSAEFNKCKNYTYSISKDRFMSNLKKPLNIVEGGR